MSEIPEKPKAARLPLGTRWQMKWHLERLRGRNKQPVAHTSTGVASCGEFRDNIISGKASVEVPTVVDLSLDPLTVVDRDACCAHIELTRALGSNDISCAAGIRTDIFQYKRCRTRRPSSKLHAENKSGRRIGNSSGNRRPSLLRLGIPATSAAGKIVLRLVGLAGLRMVLSGTCWPLLKMVCLSGFAKNPLTRVVRLVIPGRRSRVPSNQLNKASTPDNVSWLPARGPLGVAVGASQTTLAALQSLGTTLLCAQAIMFAVDIRSRLKSADTETIDTETGDLSMHVGTLGPDYSQHVPPRLLTGQQHTHSSSPAACQANGRRKSNGHIIHSNDDVVHEGADVRKVKNDDAKRGGPQSTSESSPCHSQKTCGYQRLSNSNRSSEGSQGRDNEIASSNYTPPVPPPSQPCLHSTDEPPARSVATLDDHVKNQHTAIVTPPPGLHSTTEAPDLTPGKPSHEGHIAYAPIVLDRRLRRHERGQRFLSRAEVGGAPWSDLVFWHGRDRKGRALLCVQLGLAVKVVEKGRMDSLADVILSQIESAETTWLTHQGEGSANLLPEVSVLIDAEGLGLMRRPPLECLQRIGSVLNRDYPGRGGYVYIINPPGVLGMVLAQLRRFLVPRQTGEVSHAKHGFLPGHQHVLLVGKRQKATLMDQFDPCMVPEPLYGSCECMRVAGTSCKARLPFLH